MTFSNIQFIKMQSGYTYGSAAVHMFLTAILCYFQINLFFLVKIKKKRMHRKFFSLFSTSLLTVRMSVYVIMQYYLLNALHKV